MMKANVILFLKGANVRIPLEVEFHSGYDKTDLTDIVTEMFPHLYEWGCYGELIEENPMTKLEELKAAAEAAEATHGVDLAAAWAAAEAAEAAIDDAWDAYYDELKKKQKENSND
jgi:hypothetical protein